MHWRTQKGRIFEIYVTFFSSHFVTNNKIEFGILTLIYFLVKLIYPKTYQQRIY